MILLSNLASSAIVSELPVLWPVFIMLPACPDKTYFSIIGDVSMVAHGAHDCACARVGANYKGTVAIIMSHSGLVVLR